jgi:hypothetical protein
MIQVEGISVLPQAMTFLAKMTAGDKMSAQVSEAQKKS